MGLFSDLDIMFHNGATTDQVAKYFMKRNPTLTYMQALKISKKHYLQWIRSKE